MGELAKIDACAKRPIDIWTNYLYYPLSIRLVWAIRHTRITPNALTVFSLFLCLVGTVFFAVGVRSDVLIGLLLVQISYVFDCADGQLARYKRQFSPYGGWLDQVADRVKEFAIYYTLAFGYSRVHHANTQIWHWALIALFSLYLLEYFGQIHFKPKANASATPGTAGDEEAAVGEADGSNFRKAQRLRGLIPFRGFIIGEQYFVLLVFVLLNAIAPLFYFVGCLGLIMCAYRPAVQFYKWNRGLL